MAVGLKHENGTFRDLAIVVPRHELVRHRGIIRTATKVAQAGSRCAGVHVSGASTILQINKIDRTEVNAKSRGPKISTNLSMDNSNCAVRGEAGQRLLQ
jgi:hypothetical protein